MIAITRSISPRFNECQLTHLDRTLIDLELAHTQHCKYEDALRNIGLELISLPAEADFPDSVDGLSEGRTGSNKKFSGKQPA